MKNFLCLILILLSCVGFLNAIGIKHQYGFLGIQIGLTEYDSYITNTSNARLTAQRGDSIYIVWDRYSCQSVVYPYYNLYDGSDWVFGTGDGGGTGVSGGWDIDKLGSIDVNSDGIAMIAHFYRGVSDYNKCSISKEIAPGLGVFSRVDCPSPQSIGALELIQPHVALGYQDYIYVLALAWGGGYDYALFICKSDDGGSSFSSWYYITDRGYKHCIAASKRSPKVAISWQDSWFQESLDYSDTWSTPISFVEDLPGSLKIPFYTSMLYDKYDRLHIIFCLIDTGIPYFTGPKKIYHYCPDYTPHHSLIYVYQDTLTHRVTRDFIGLSIAQDTVNKLLYAVWIDYTSDDYDTLSGYCNGDIYGSYSMDYGMSWSPATNITQTYGLSERSPCLPELVLDSLCILYLGNIVAGLYPPDTANPIMCYTIPPLIGIEENQDELNSTKFSLVVSPNPFNDKTQIHFSCPRPSRISLKIYNLTGSLIKTVIDGEIERGDYTYFWDGANAGGSKVPSGIYFIQFNAGEYSKIQKLLKMK